MGPSSYAGAADDGNPPAGLMPLRLIWEPIAAGALGPAPVWGAVPEEFLFGFWQTGVIELWGRRGWHDAALALIAAPPPERQWSAYDAEELRCYSCLCRRRGETYFDIHWRVCPPTFPVVPLLREANEQTARGVGRPSAREDIQAAYRDLADEQRRLRGKPLYRAIRLKKFGPIRSARTPANWSDDAIADALRLLKN
jgi:hypothetical protein